MPAICETSSMRARARHGCFRASPRLGGFGKTRRSTHGVPLALSPSVMRTAAHVPSSPSPWRSVPGSVPQCWRRCSPTIPIAMPPDVALACKFTRATLAHDAAADEYREEIVKLWGRRALVSLAFAITAARLYPTVKYALGHGKACMRVVVGGRPVNFDHGRMVTGSEMAARTS